jgi:hypothetical protein
MAEGLHLLQNVAVFRDAGYAKLAQIAFAMKFMQVSAKSRLVSAGDPVQAVYLLGTGLVSVLSKCDPNRGGAQTATAAAVGGSVFKSLSLAVAQWGKGFVVGERELLAGLSRYENTYETADSCEMFEIPVQLCQEVREPPAMIGSCARSHETNSLLQHLFFLPCLSVCRSSSRCCLAMPPLRLRLLLR